MIYSLICLMQIFYDQSNKALQDDTYVKALVGSIQSIVLQPPSKSGNHSVLSDMIDRNSGLLAQWAIHSLDPKDFVKYTLLCVLLEYAMYIWSSTEISLLYFMNKFKMADRTRTLFSLVRKPIQSKFFTRS